MNISFYRFSFALLFAHLAAGCAKSQEVTYNSPPELPVELVSQRTTYSTDPASRIDDITLSISSADAFWIVELFDSYNEKIALDDSTSAAARTVLPGSIEIRARELRGLPCLTILFSSSTGELHIDYAIDLCGGEVFRVIGVNQEGEIVHPREAEQPALSG